MPEMILPGTYIEVRAEKLIAAGPISISNVAVVGTAARGPLHTPIALANLGEAREIFGRPDDYENPETVGSPLTLLRALELVYANGGQKIYAVRVAAGTGAGAGVAAQFNLPAATGNVVATSGRMVNRVAVDAPGSGYNGARFEIAPIPIAPPVTVPPTPPPPSTHANVTITLGTAATGMQVETWRDVPLRASAAPDTPGDPPVADNFADLLNGLHPTYPYASKASTGGGSQLFTFNASTAAGTVTATTSTTPIAASTAGTNGAAAAPTDYGAGLEALLTENVHIIVLAGQSAGTMADELAAHCELASSDSYRRERIGVIGPEGDVLAANSPDQIEGRLVFVGPGLATTDSASGREVRLPASYAAAAVAGRIASLDAHASPTNKTINANGVTRVLNGAQLESMVLGRKLALELRNGAIKIVKGITTSSNSAYAQITTRRIVDYAKFGVRSACDPYIGKLNNERVRQALKGTINGFLADMVDQEMLISYELEVSATREQQIRGIAQVAMILRPTFSIDYIRVIMNLE